MGALAGRRVVVTRAAEQADELVTLLQAAGAVPVVVRDSGCWRASRRAMRALATARSTLARVASCWAFMR